MATTNGEISGSKNISVCNVDAAAVVVVVVVVANVAMSVCTSVAVVIVPAVVTGTVIDKDVVVSTVGYIEDDKEPML